MSLDHPYWIEDPDFDLDFHVRHTAVAAARQRRADRRARGPHHRPAARPHAARCGRRYVIEGLPDDRFAILTKVHHATVDGASGAELLTLMLDSDPEGDEIAAADDDVAARAGCRPTAR